MRKIKTPAMALLLSACLSTSALAADWFDLEGMGTHFTQRVAVTIENPADVPTEAALVHLPLADLKAVLPDAKDGQVAVVDPTKHKAKREQADQNFVPFQVSNDQLIFAIPLKAHESRQLYIYTSPTRANLPGFPAKTSYDSRHAYRSFENNLMAFRMETGPGANTTGMAIDLFGKTKAGKGLRLVELYEQGDYHHPQTWGVDILKVGSSPGVGGAYVIYNNQMGRASSDTTFVDLVYTGPVETMIRATAPVEVGGKKVTVVRTLRLVADDRTIHDHVEIQGPDTAGLQMGIALRDLPNQTWLEQPIQGYAMVTGDHNQPGCKSIGFGFLFIPGEYDRMLEVPDKNNGGHIYVLNSLSSDHRLCAIWDSDSQVSNPPDLQHTLERWAQLRDMPIKVDVAKQSEKK